MNLKLSSDRAASVMGYLISHGISSGRLQSQGFGQTKPIADNNTDAGRAKNRRVEFKILSGAD
jgi:OOP family OmpA-OmpF porin